MATRAIQKPLRRLNNEELQSFEREGYLVVDRLFDDADLQPVIDELTDEITKRATALVKAGELSSTFEEKGFERQLTFVCKETDKVAVDIWNGVLNGPAIFNLIAHPKLVEIAAQLCGEELVASSVYRVRPKIAGHRMGPVPWHQDSGYFEPYCDKDLVLTVWLPLVDATRERGCLWVVPRAHKGEVVRHVVAKGHPYLEIPDEDLPKSAEPVCVPVNKGGVLLLTNRSPHASFENHTDITRWSMDLRYQNAKLPTNARITRLPGESIPSEQVPGACYPPEADFLLRSKLRPGEVVTDPAEFERIRKDHKPGGVSPRWDTSTLTEAQKTWSPQANKK